jgi:hypothetical protein
MWDTWPAHPILLYSCSLIIDYSVRRTNYEATHYAIFPEVFLTFSFLNPNIMFNNLLVKNLNLCGADNFTAIFESIVKKMWEPRRLTILWASAACYRHRFALFSPNYKRAIQKVTSVYFRQLMYKYGESSRMRGSVT